jgi:hypothetical protein
MRKLCERLRGEGAAIVAEWDSLVAAEGWHRLPAEIRIDGLLEVVFGLLDAAMCEPEALASHRRKIEAAVGHGRHRREHGFSESELLLEYHLLRQAMWRHIRRIVADREHQVEAIFRIDSAITLATTGTLYGYYAPEVEERGSLGERVETLARESPFLQGSDAGDPPGDVALHPRHDDAVTGRSG